MPDARSPPIFDLSLLARRMAEFPPEVIELLTRLREWCDAEPGRRVRLRDAMSEPKRNVSDQTLSNWLYLRKRPSLEYWIKFEAFAKKNRIPRK